eukprot:TRINITY_DN11645_c0_g1_i4.p1 TRINITY_DN11645_c0_g1~~TRINITY_DN11645_c0_g1_i4.p1  ORF type:complete len:369 (+),score=70.90 TRINITY_DN11645_c0_g1_i4:65-1171(+)
MGNIFSSCFGIREDKGTPGNQTEEQKPLLKTSGDIPTSGATSNQIIHNEIHMPNGLSIVQKENSPVNARLEIKETKKGEEIPSNSQDPTIQQIQEIKLLEEQQIEIKSVSPIQTENMVMTDVKQEEKIAETKEIQNLSTPVEETHGNNNNDHDEGKKEIGLTHEETNTIKEEEVKIDYEGLRSSLVSEQILNINGSKQLEQAIILLNSKEMLEGITELKIVFGDTNYPKETWANVAKVIGALANQLVALSVNLNSVKVTGDNFGTIIKDISACQSLEVLNFNLRGSSIGDKNFLAFRGQLGKLAKLSKLTLTLQGNSILTVEGYKFLRDAMTKRDENFNLELVTDIQGVEDIYKGLGFNVKLNNKILQ